MRIRPSVGRPKVPLSSLSGGDVFYRDGTYYMKLRGLDSAGRTSVVYLVDGHQTFYDGNPLVTPVNGEFVEGA